MRLNAGLHCFEAEVHDGLPEIVSFAPQGGIGDGSLATTREGLDVMVFKSPSR